MKEMRLIDASFENAKEILEKVPYYPDEIWKFAAMAERFPTVDAVPVVHGRWEKIRGVIGNYECSLCGCIPYYAGSIHTLNYCPNCGAKMDGGVEDV